MRRRISSQRISRREGGLHGVMRGISIEQIDVPVRRVLSRPEVAPDADIFEQPPLHVMASLSSEASPGRRGAQGTPLFLISL